MKKYFKYILLSFIMFITIGAVKANNISDINMDIYIDKNGDAHVRESWTANLTQGTEGYRFYNNLGNSEITDFSVKDETRSYQDIGDWDVDASFDEKAYKYGINDKGDYKELCFGISKYGTHTYTMNYIITKFVKNTTDNQIAYWELVPKELAQNTKVYIKIHSDEKFKDTLDVWGYGNKGGYAYVYDGYIEMSNDNLNGDQYMTILVKFDKGTFNTTDDLEENFDHYMKMAEEGAEHYVPKTSFFDKIMGFITLFFTFGIWIIIIVVAVFAGKSSGNKSGDLTLDFTKSGRKFPKDVPLFRDLPCNKDVYRAYWVAYNFNLMKKKTDFLGTILLKWLSEDKVEIKSKEKGIFKKDQANIVFKENLEFDIEEERNLYNYMYEASKDGILESHEFERWCKSHYSKILRWFDKVLNYENDILIKEGMLTSKEKTSMKVFKSTVYEVDPKMFEEATQMKGLKDFFKEFENMQDKEAIEVKFWQFYLMYAQLFGVAEKVAKQFKKLYPDVITDYSYDGIVYVSYISTSGMSSAQSAKSRAESYSSGGGGFSSGGGGGGSFGGGGGGGFR